MIRIARVLCATDLSPASGPAWDEAQRLAGLLEAEVLLLHVVPPVPVPMEGYFPPNLYQQVIDAEHREAHEGLDRLAQGASDGRLKVSLHVDQGSAAARIVAAAEAHAADLVVMGTHGRAGLERIVLGSVADRVIRTAPCPVVTVRARPPEAGPGARRPITRILYATDFSPVAQAAWLYVVTLAEAAGAEVDLLHVTPTVVPDRHLSADAIGRMAQFLHDQGQASAQQVVQKGPLPHTRVHVLIRSGVVADQIVHWAQARSADLIVMGTHGWSGLLRWMLGSVAHHVIQAAPCPVLTVAPPGRNAEPHHAD